MRLSADMSKTYASVGQAGTSRYMSPELLDRYADIGRPESYKQVDIYSLSLVLWEILNKCNFPELDESPGNYLLYKIEIKTGFHVHISIVYIFGQANFWSIFFLPFALKMREKHKCTSLKENLCKNEQRKSTNK